jgi:hypothetical protein
MHYGGLPGSAVFQKGHRLLPLVSCVPERDEAVPSEAFWLWMGYRR